MPQYEYRCEICNQSFTLKMSMAEHEKGGVVCPACKATKVVPQFTAFFAKTSKKS